MKARMLLLAAVVAVLVPAGAQAGVTTSTSLRQYAQVYFDVFDPMTQTQEFGLFSIYSSAGGITSGTSATPSTDAKAIGYRYSCGPMGCTDTYFPQQTVTTTALSMDPVGNQVTIDACLLPSAGGGCQNFDLQLVRPGYLTYAPCVPCAPNFWWDDDTASASVAGLVGISRENYEVSGTFAGAPLAVGEVWSEAGTTVGSSATVSLP